MQNTEWIINNPKLPNNLLNMNIDKNLLEILYKRGLRTQEEIEKFLNPNINDLAIPKDFVDIEKSAKRIGEAIQNREKIVIYGDYDVDGMTSTSLMVLGLRKLGANVDFYIPHRDEGYGLNNEAIKQIRENGANLMITVDCGISSNDEIEYANSQGLETIITDHHEINNELPEAFAVINPKRDENRCKFRSLAGVGTAFMLILQTYKEHNLEAEAYNFLDIVSIGTVADIVPLIDQNRIFVKYGLDRLKKTDNLGLKILLGLLFEKEGGNFFSDDIGFRIAPVFNSAGRLEYAKTTVDLLTSDSETESKLLAKKLIKQNSNRKEIEKEISNKVEEKIEEEKLFENNIIIVEGADFHHGVIGIVASRVTEKYYKPSIILELKDNGNAVASARSIEGFNIIEAIDNIKDIMVKYGGHEGAAGFTIKQENMEQLKEKLYKYTKEKMDETNFVRPIPIDEELPFFKVSYEFYTTVSKLRPFGFGNHNPVFAIKNVSINNIRKVGQTKDHIMFDIERDVTIKNCIWFNKVELHNQLNRNKNFDIAFNIKCELYKDRYYIKLFIEDVKESKKNDFKYLIPMKIYDISFPLETIVYTKVEVDLNKDFDIDLESGYKNIPVINNNKIVGFLTDQLTYIVNKHKKYFNSKFKFKFKNFTKAREIDQLKLIIEKDYSFSTYATSDKLLFNDIKKFLIGDFEYTSIQKKVLSSIFKNKNSTIFIGDLNRGINTVVLTCGIYFYYKKNRKLTLVKKDETILPEIFLEYFEIVDASYIENIDKNFIILYNVVSNKIQNGLIVSEKKININGFKNIEDNFNLPEKIKIVEENDLEEVESKSPIYSAKLPMNIRKEVLENIDSYNIVYATKDILAAL